MIEVLNLALPYFGLIFLGYRRAGGLKQIPETGLAWMNFFIIYVSLPCLFYRIAGARPRWKQLDQRAASSSGPCCRPPSRSRCRSRSALSVRRTMAEATIAGLAGGYGNIGYMGPGLALSTLGARRRTRRSR